MTFSEGVKFPKGWRVKLDPEAPNATPYSADTNIVPRHNIPKWITYSLRSYAY
ncbi:hypothetical protein HCJ82_16315 [Listeria booriae]|uniref:hypothetical protein n=1 Tax=Listeria booriae TaxID=1552123 RepID=UPI00162A03A7|nr:hypothetical protein [Listeria booriae]MBC2181732.1 hypothetical protein [Listeria booriae]